MSKNINVNPDHYKTRGRERPGQDVPAELIRQRYASARARVPGGEIELQQSGKTGVRSAAQKQARSRKGFAPMPATSPVAGASGNPRSKRKRRGKKK